MSFYSIPSLFSFISYLALSIYLLIFSLKKSESTINWLFLITSLLITFYSFSIFISKNIFNPEKAYYWIRASYFAMIYILPVLIVSIYYFIYDFFPKPFYFIFFLIEIPIFHLLLSSDFLFQGVERTFYGFRELRGEYYPAFLAVLFFFELLGIFIFLIGLKRIKNSLKKAQLLFLLYGFLSIFILSAIIQIGLPYSGNYTYYFGYFSFILFLASFLIWYLIIKYKFLGTNIIIQKGTVYLLIVSIFIFSYILLIEVLLPFKDSVFYNYLTFLKVSFLLSLIYVRYSEKIIKYFYSLLFNKEYKLERYIYNLEIQLNKYNRLLKFKQALEKNVKKIFQLSRITLQTNFPDELRSEVLQSPQELFIKDYLELDPYEIKKYSCVLKYLNEKKLSGILIFKYTRNPVGLLEFNYPNFKIFKWYEVILLSKLGRIISLKFHNIKLNEEISRKRYIEIISILHSSIIHDTKNIITYLNLFTQNIKNVKYSIKTANMMKSSLKNSYQKLQKLKNKLMFTGISSHKKQVVKIDSLIIKYIKQNYYIFKDIEISSDLKSRSEIYIDPENIKFLLDNIILNAQESILQKNIPGKIDVSTLRMKDRILIKVKDNGIGLEFKELKNLLKPFYTGKKKGLGIGLYICNKLLKQNNGDFFIKSKKNKFTEVLINFPAANKNNLLPGKAD